MKRVNGAAAQIRSKLNAALSLAHGMRMLEFGKSYQDRAKAATENLEKSMQEWGVLSEPMEIVE